MCHLRFLRLSPQIHLRGVTIFLLQFQIHTSEGSELTQKDSPLATAGGDLAEGLIVIHFDVKKCLNFCKRRVNVFF